MVSWGGLGTEEEDNVSVSEVEEQVTELGVSFGWVGLAWSGLD